MEYNIVFSQLLKPLSRLIVTFTITLSLTQVFAQQEELNTNSPDTNQQQSENKDANTKTFEVFIPSEEILGDQSVDFPTDI